MMMAHAIITFDGDKFSDGSKELGKFAILQYDKSPKDWFDNINLMNSLANEDFDEFGKVFFSGDNKRTVIKQNIDSDAEGREIITYLTIKMLDQIIRNRNKKFDDRM